MPAVFRLAQIDKGGAQGFMTEVLPSGTVRLSRDSGGVDTRQL